ncbi:MAG: radical SAM protein, partial [Chloroflexota bacterium]
THLFHLFPGADYGLCGEGELGLLALVRVLASSALEAESLACIPGLIWRDGDATRLNPSHYVDDLDTLPFPAWELMPPASFPGPPFNGYSRRHPIAPMILTRGCPHLCTFCGAATVNGRRLRTRSAENILAELRLLITRYGVREIQFYDSNCADRFGPLRAVLRQIIAEGIDITWSAPNGIRVDAVDAELVDLMRRSGCFQVNVGIESGSPRIQRQIRKNLSLDTVRRAVGLLRGAGIEVVGFFMLGFPGEMRADIRQTLALAMELPLTGASFSIYCPLPGTEDYATTFRAGRPDHAVLDSFDFVSYENNLSGVPAAELRAIQRRAYVQFHLRPMVLRAFLRNLNSMEKVRLIAGHVRQKVFGL